MSDFPAFTTDYHSAAATSTCDWDLINPQRDSVTHFLPFTTDS